jgi:lipopolysaccharide export LptBFGC system permease protein LptF
VQLHKKFSVPLFALIMAMISAPFAFLVGNRGAMAGVGASIGVAIAYLAIQKLFEEIGNVNHLPPAIAAWSPDAVFSLAGSYLLLKMRS